MGWGRDDPADGLRIADRVYGREAEVQQLERALVRADAGGHELLLVSGSAGVGKTALVHELRRSAAARGGRFVEGKFDQFARATPYNAWGQAVGELLEGWLAGGVEVDLSRRRSTLLEALGLNGQLLVDLVPILERLIGPQPTVQALGGQEARGRFAYLFCQFLRAIASTEAPLVVFLDDLQWIDAGSLELLDAVSAERELRGLLVVGAYRDEEVEASHPLALTLQAMNRQGRPVTTLALGDLQATDIEDLVTDALGPAPLDGSKALARWIHQQTQGNPLFVRRFLCWMEQEGHLRFDSQARSWTWDGEAVRLTAVANNVADLLVGELARLPAETVSLLELAAFLGGRFDVATLAVVSEVPESVVRQRLTPALAQRLLYAAGDRFAFAHDRVQQAAYALADDGERQQRHLRVGQLLLAARREDRAHQLFAIVDHLNAGEALVRPGKQRTELARLNLEAGTMAHDAGAFVAAADYFQAGLRCLPRSCWRAHHALAFDLHSRAAEAAFVNQRFELADRLVDQALAHTDRAVQRAELYTTRIAQLTMQARYADAKQVGREALEGLGVQLPRQDLQAALAEQLQRIDAQLGARKIAYLVDAPELQVPEIRAAAKLLAGIVPACYFTDDILWAVGMAQATTFALEHGSAIEFAYPLVGVSLALSALTGQHDLGLEFGEAALKLCEKYGDRLQLAKVAEPFACHVLPWVRPVREAEPLIRDGYQAARESGEISYAGYMLSTRLSNMLFWQEDLAELQRSSETSLAYNRETLNALGLHLALAYQLFLRRMGRPTTDRIAFDQVVLDETSFVETCKSKHIEFALCQFYVLRACARYLHKDVAGALADIDQARVRVNAIAGMLSNADLNFYHSLALCAKCSDMAQAERQQGLQEVQANQKQLGRWAEQCPQNFQCRYLLVQAELARLAGQRWEALDLYDHAIGEARNGAFIQVEALGNELAGEFWLAHGKQGLAGHYLLESWRLYERWGAVAKATDLQARHPELVRPNDGESSAARGSRRTEDGRAVVNVGSISKAARDIAREGTVEQVTRAILDVAIENAGAERGLMIMPKEGDWAIAAGAAPGDGRPQAPTRLALTGSPLLPESIVRHVIREVQPLVLEDATSDERFCQDRYLQRVPVRSVLCVPLVDRGQLRGAIYLENNLLRRAFTADRVEPLRLLSPQMAISLENARIRHDLAQVADRFVATFEQAAVGVAHVGIEGQFLRINRRFCDIVGYPRDEMLRRTFQDITHPDDLDADLASLARLRDGAIETYSLDKRYLRSSGEIVWVRLTASALRADDGRPQFYIAVVEDITDRKAAEVALRRSEERYRALFEHAGVGIAIADARTRQLKHANSEFCRMLGYSREELLELRIDQLHPPGGMVEERAVPRFEEAQRQRTELTNFPFAAKDGRTVYTDGIGTAIDVEGTAEVVGFFRDSTDRKLAEDRVQQYQHRLKAVALQMTIAEERERRRIAAHLHDTVGQALALARVQIATTRGCSADSDVSELLDGLSSSLLQAIRVTRQIMSDLSPPQITELGIGAAISEWLEEQVGEKHDLEVAYRAAGDDPKLSDDLRALLFRSVRELLANVVKHAHARRVSVLLESREDEVRITVVDDGIGFDPAHAASSKPNDEGGFGLFSIQERMGDLGGSLELAAEPGAGCTAVLALPLAAEPTERSARTSIAPKDS